MKLSMVLLGRTLSEFSGNVDHQTLIMMLASLNLNDPKLRPMERQAIKDLSLQYAGEIKAYRANEINDPKRPGRGFLNTPHTPPSVSPSVGGPESRALASLTRPAA